MSAALWWIKRDFRLHDNQALSEAIAQHQYVLPVFLLEPDLLQAHDTSRFHWHYQLNALRALKTELQSIGADLLVLSLDAISAFEWLHKRMAFSHIYSHQETGNDMTFKRDNAVLSWSTANNVTWQQYLQFGVIRCLKNRDQRNELLKPILFEQTPLIAPKQLPFHPKLAKLCQQSKIPNLADLPIEDIIQDFTPSQLQDISEAQGQATLNDFLSQRSLAYMGGISSPNSAFVAGSRLSAHLAWGTLSLRQVFYSTFERMAQLKQEQHPDVGRWRKSLSAFQSRLHWHCHFIQRLESAPSMEFKALNPAYEAIDYSHNKQRLHAWIMGETGFPLVDACMRCLHATGFLNFRMRAMVVNFACYALHLDWRDLHGPLAQLFADYEPGIHLSQLQMQAGMVGINTMRVYNVNKQLLEQDPQGIFCRRYVAPLRNVPMADWLNPLHNIAGYPRPIVRAHTNTEQMKQQIMAIRKSEAAKEPTRQVLQQHGSRAWRNDRNSRPARRKSHKKVSKDQLSLDL